MQNFWWQLPGPKRFVLNIVEDFRKGKNIIICLPKYSPKNIENQLRNLAREESLGGWNKITLKSLDKKPLEFLFSYFAIDGRNDMLKNCQNLVHDENFKGKIIWINGITHENWDEWREFIMDYSQTSRNIPLIERSLFCIPLEGELSKNLPPEELCLSYHRWNGCVNSLDMAIYTYVKFQDIPLTYLKKRLSISLITHIALWDQELADRLAFEDMKNIINPEPILKEMASERNWLSIDHTDYLNGSAWHNGLLNIIDDKEKVHSAVFAFNDIKNEIQQRIWCAEIEVVYPFIEEKRREIIGSHTGLLEVPYTTSTGELITDINDLEIGHIYSQLCYYNSIVEPKMKRQITVLREIRNNLTHLETIAPELLLNSTIDGF